MVRLKCILIDADQKSIKQIGLNCANADDCLDELSEVLGCGSVESIEIDENNLLYLDSHGLLKKHESYIHIKDYPSLLPPKLIIIGFDNSDDSDEDMSEDTGYKDTTFSVESIKDMVMFLTKTEAKAFAAMRDQQMSVLDGIPFVINTKLSDLIS